MGQVLVDSDSLTAIGDAIRKKTNQVIKYKPAEMPAAINSINSLKLGGYKVNITQSDHQTIHVTQSTFNDQESGFTIEDHPTINISLTADPGYIAGSLNLTNFTFSNDVREVDIFATPATYSPNNITYNGNMNVIRGGASFNITSASSSDSSNHYNEAFDLELVDFGDIQIYELRIDNKDNFYSLDPDTEYQITALKIGDTSLSSDDLADGRPTLSTVSAHINADLSKDWVKSVYKQCTGKELIKKIDLSDFPSADILDSVMQSADFLNQGSYVGQQIADRLYKSETVSSAIVNTYINKYDTSEFFKTLSSDRQTEFANSVESFMTSYETNTTGLRDGNLIQNYFNVLKQFQDRYADDATATSVLEKYNPLKNSDFKDSNPADMFKIVYNIDPSNTYGFTSSLNGGLAYVLWVFYVYYYTVVMIIVNTKGFTPDDPIISTIPVSITFTKVTQ